MKFLLYLFTLALNGALVKGVFMDEAFVNDWQMANIGRYECVLENRAKDQLVLLSEIDGKTLISYMNETDGKILIRNKLDVRIVDAMCQQDTGLIILKDSEQNFLQFNDTFGFSRSLIDFEESTFVSTCYMNLDHIKISNTQLKVMDQESNLELFHSDLPEDYSSIEFIKTDYAGKLKVLYQTQALKYEFQLFENGILYSTWTRDETLTGVTAHEFVTLPDFSMHEASAELFAESMYSNPFAAYAFRIGKNYHRFVNYLTKSGFSPGRILTNLLFSESTEDAQDIIAGQAMKFGFSKILVVSTNEGIVSGLDIKNGNKLWEISSIRSKVIYLNWNEFKSELLIVFENGAYKKYSIINFDDPIFNSEGKLNFKVKSFNKLGDSDSYLVAYQNGEKEILHLSDEETGAQIEQSYIVDHNSKGVFGHIQRGNSKLQDTWTLHVSESEEIVSFSAKQSNPIISCGKILGNRTVLYKYMYPNLASYAVLNKETHKLYINVIDTVTGGVLYTQVHNDKVALDSLINMVFGENWVIYTYFSLESIPEQKIAVIELYDSITPDKRISNPLIEYDALEGIYKPEVITKSYIFPEIIKNIHLAKTKFGITSKTLIVELENGQITTIPKNIISARRIKESDMSADDKKEFMAAPYMSSIPINDLFVVTHSRGLLMGEDSEISSVSTNLESTSIICDIGHDIFCTRISPSSQFDLMSPIFEKGKLLATIVIMVAILLYLRPKVTSKKLKILWMVRN